MPDKVVINAIQLTKTYKLYNRPLDRVKEAFNPFGRKFHRVFYALEEMSLAIRKGETVGIIGRNGSGKSTLLQVMSGVLKPSSGEIQVKGRVSALLELGAGFNPNFTGRENVYLNAAILGFSQKEIDRLYPKIVEFADIGDFIDQPVRVYSSGMYVRLAFAVAINVDPDILVVDEALAVGDAQFQSKCFAKFRALQEKGVTIIFVTHALDLVTRYCSRAFLIEKGQVLSSGYPKTIVDEYNRLIVDCNTQAQKSIAHQDVIRRPPKRDSKDIDLLKNTDLFWDGLFQINPQENRYGEGKARIIEAGIFDRNENPTQTLIKNRYYIFKLRIRFNQPLTEPIFAYTIKDVQGFDISGTNTLFQEIKTGRFKSDDEIIVTFQHNMTLNPGGYLLSFGCAGYEDGKYIVHDRRYDHFVFEVISDKAYVGFVDIGSKIIINKTGDNATDRLVDE